MNAKVQKHKLRWFAFDILRKKGWKMKVKQKLDTLIKVLHFVNFVKCFMKGMEEVPSSFENPLMWDFNLLLSSFIGFNVCVCLFYILALWLIYKERQYFYSWFASNLLDLIRKFVQMPAKIDERGQRETKSTQQMMT